MVSLIQPPPKLTLEITVFFTLLFLVKRYSASGFSFFCNIRITSAKSEYANTGRTGPKISSCITLLLSVSPARSVGSIFSVSASILPPVMISPSCSKSIFLRRLKCFSLIIFGYSGFKSGSSRYIFRM